MKLNGWQRLWVFVSIPFVIGGVTSLVSSGFENLNSSDMWAGVFMAIIWPALMYAIGWGIAWVRRGFKGQ